MKKIEGFTDEQLIREPYRQLYKLLFYRNDKLGRKWPTKPQLIFLITTGICNSLPYVLCSGELDLLETDLHVQVNIVISYIH